MVLICNGPKITLRCGTCGTGSPGLGRSPKALEKNQIGTIAAHSAWPTRMNRWTGRRRSVGVGQAPPVKPADRQIPSNLACRALAAFGRVKQTRQLILHASFAAMHHSRERDGV